MVQRFLVALVALLALAPSCAHATTWMKRVIAGHAAPDPLLASAANGSAILAWDRPGHARGTARWLAVDAQGRPGPVHATAGPPPDQGPILDLDVSPAGAAILCTESYAGSDVVIAAPATRSSPGASRTGAREPAKAVR